MAESMRITTTAGDLVRTLKAIQPAASKRYTNIPVLMMAKFSGGRITATCIDIEMSAALPHAGFTGEGLAPFWTLLRLSGAFDATDELVLASGEGDGVVVTCGAATYRLTDVPLSDFPEITLPDTMVSVAVDGGSLHGAVKFVKPYASQEETRYYLNGVCFHGRAVVTTDGHRLGLVEDVFDESLTENIIVPNDAVKALLSMAPASSMLVGGGKMRVNSAGVVLTAKLIDGTFPDFRRVIPSSVEQETVLDRVGLLRILRRLDAIVDVRAQSVSLVADGDRLAVAHYHPEFGRGLEIMGAHGSPFQATYNMRYLKDVLGSLDGEAAHINHDGSKSAPVILRSATGKRLLVLMPMRDGGVELDIAISALAEGDTRKAAA